MHKYGLQLLLWTESYDASGVDLIGHAKELGFDGVEILIPDPQTFPVKETAEALKKHDMEINFAACLDEQTNSISEDSDVRKNATKFLKGAIDVAYELTGGGCGVGGVNYAAWGYFTGKPRTAQQWDWAVAHYKEAAKHAQDKNITLCVEPINRFETFFINTAADAVQFCKDVGEPNAKVHLDTYHMIREEKNFRSTIMDTGEYLGYLHACENERGVPGTGLVPWDEVYTALKDVGYKGWITIESFTQETKELARLTAIWRKLAPSSEELARQGLANLKKIERRIG